jgi:general stress protein 26
LKSSLFVVFCNNSITGSQTIQQNLINNQKISEAVMNKHFRTKNTSYSILLLVILLLFVALQWGNAQEQKSVPVNRDTLIVAAREIIAAQKYCALVTLDSMGRPDIRTMNPFSPEEDMSVWMATNSRSRKIEEIQRNPHVCLYYANHGQAIGSVVIKGTAVLVDDMEEKLKRKREYWSQSFPDWKYLILIKIIPERIEVIHYKRGLSNSPITWSVPAVEFKKP